MPITARRVTSTIGAEVSGVDLAKPLSPAEQAEIEKLLLEHLVLAFRGQNITIEEQIAFARQFGTIAEQPFTTKYEKSPEYVVLDQISPKGDGADSWHSDNSFMAKPPWAAVLKASRLPAVGGDTCFANMYAAFEGLSKPMREMLEGLKAVHDITKPLQKAINSGHAKDDADLRAAQQQWPPAEHPVVRTHPVTGRKALFVNPNSTTRILGLSERESNLLLPFLNDHVRSPDYQCRFSWDEGTVIFWDNRPVQHYAVADYDERRVMHRVALAGDRPV
ncbi:MAG: TauD/TfdA family dioxygenase [Deltaproteobacteria bacterium]|nr:TauD/TfdA family dioxygenase [Deltaproteobacteria bacterium]